MSHLAVVTPQSEQSPARRKLADAIAAKAAADALHTEAAATVNAASSLLRQEDTARAQLDTMNRRNAECVTEWAKSGGKGKPNIVDTLTLTTLQHDMDVATANANAARAALPDLQKNMEAARASSNAERNAVDHAVREVLVEEAAAIDAEIVALFDRVTALRARLYGIASYAMRQPHSGAFTGAIQRLVERYVSEPTNAAVAGHQDQWRLLASRLATDPDATIQPE